MVNRRIVIVGTVTAVIGVLALLIGWILLTYGMVSGSGTKSYENEGPILYAFGTVLIVLGGILCIVGAIAERSRRKGFSSSSSDVERQE